MWAWDLRNSYIVVVHVRLCIHVYYAKMAVQFWMVVFYVCSCQREEELEAVLCLPQRIPALLWTGTIVMPSHLYMHVHVHVHVHTTHCQLPTWKSHTLHCTFMCTFLERIKCKEASLEGGGREGEFTASDCWKEAMYMYMYF